jgi:3-methyladenine DNA glycosylase/8-oxoguanine DNA glycosylase
MRLLLPTPPDFDFRSAVCSHGFFVLAPNKWNPKTQSLRTMVTIDDETAVPVVVSEKRGGPDARGRGRIVLSSPVKLGPSQGRVVSAAIWRMLRLAEDLTRFHTLCRQSTTHQPAAEMHFGRLLRSSSLFEDIVKVICTCNTSWAQTVSMVQRITDTWGIPTADGAGHGFPTPDRLADVPAAVLRKMARVGYRAEFLHRLACAVADGRLDLKAVEHFSGPSDELYRMLRAIHGVGNYAAAHLCMLLGHYDRLAVDTELKRFLADRHPRKRFTPAALRGYYDHWHPYQFLAYWFELWSDYTRRHGQSHEWDPGTTGRRITTPG